MSEETPLAIKLLAEHARQIQNFFRHLGKRTRWGVIVPATIAVVGSADSRLEIAAFRQARQPASAVVCAR